MFDNSLKECIMDVDQFCRDDILDIKKSIERIVLVL